MNSGDNEEQPSLSRDFIMTEESSKHENILNDDVWLIMGNDPIKSSEGDRWSGWCPGRAVMVSSIKKRDEYIAKHISTIFKNGYTIRRASNLKELRNELCAIMPLPANIKDSPNNIASVVKTSTMCEIKRYELFRNVIKHEDDLLNERVSWIILAQSFLMAAFITSSGPNSLRYVTAVVGMGIVIVTLPAIVAAAQNIELQQKIYFQKLESDERCLELHGHTRDGPKEKDEMMQRIYQGHLLPTMAFRGRGGIRILKTVVLLAIVQFFGWISLLFALKFDM